MKHIMLDLETLSLKPTAAIVAIGACFFDPFESYVHEDDTFYITVAPASSIAAGSHVDGDTIAWWMKQENSVRMSTFHCAPVPLVDALQAFAGFAWRSQEPVAIWGNGATFDNVVLRSAYEACKLDAPWVYKNDKCYRTLINLIRKETRPEYVTVGNYHNAKDDAVSQALHLQKIYRVLNLTAA